MTPDGPLNPHKMSYSEMKESMLDFEGDLVEKQNSVRTMMSDEVPNERMEIEEVASNLEMTLIDNLYDQEHSGCNSADRSTMKLLVRDNAISHYKMSI